MQGVIYIVYAVLQYLVVTAFLLRLILPLARANMRNPISQAVLRVTNPLVLPLRRVLPPIGRVDTASVLALLIVQFVTVLSVSLLARLPIDSTFLANQTLLSLFRATIQIYSFALLLYALISWLAPHTYSPASDLLSALTEPILRRLRRIIPPVAGLDLSVFFALIMLTAILISLPDRVFPFD